MAAQNDIIILGCRAVDLHIVVIFLLRQSLYVSAYTSCVKRRPMPDSRGKVTCSQVCRTWAHPTPHSTFSYTQPTIVSFQNIVAGWDQAHRRFRRWLLRTHLEPGLGHWAQSNEWTVRISKMANALWISALVQGFITQSSGVMDWCNFSHLDRVGDVVYMMKCCVPCVISPVGRPEGVSTESTSVQITDL